MSDLALTAEANVVNCANRKIDILYVIGKSKIQFDRLRRNTGVSPKLILFDLDILQALIIHRRLYHCLHWCGIPT